jgi:hypothetical protein
LRERKKKNKDRKRMVRGTTSLMEIIVDAICESME